MLNAVHLCHLLLEPGAHPRAQAHLSSASGLVRVARRLYTVADDEHHLGLLEPGEGDRATVHLHRLLAGDLPGDPSNRKARKPDLEALVHWPVAGHVHGALLAIGSGSRPNRQQAFLVGLDAQGLPAGRVRILDLAALYQPLHALFADLNIEGAFIDGARLRLLQRGNKGDARNASVDYALADIQSWLADGTTPAPLEFTRFDLGEVGGAPLGFTDGAALPGGGWIFSAVAEDTIDSYHDGACAGSALGWVGPDGRMQRLDGIAGGPKVEGIALAEQGRLLMVTDSDDPDIASALLSVVLD